MTPAPLGNRELIYQILASRNHLDELKPFIDWEYARAGVRNGTEGTVADRLFLCYLLKITGEDERAAENIRIEESRIDQNSFEARYNFAVELARTNLYEESYASLDELADDYPQSPQTYELMMAIAHALGKYEEALEAANRLLELNPTSAEYRDTRDSLMSLVNAESTGDSLEPAP
jgi:tetratricopeptide (TPR) repeat protein